MDLERETKMSAHTSDPIHDMFVEYKTIAVVGLSAKLDRPSYRVAKFFARTGLPDYTCYSDL